MRLALKWDVSSGPLAGPAEGWTLSREVETTRGWSAPGLPEWLAQSRLSVPGTHEQPLELHTECGAQALPEHYVILLNSGVGESQLF